MKYFLILSILITDCGHASKQISQQPTVLDTTREFITPDSAYLLNWQGRLKGWVFWQRDTNGHYYYDVDSPIGYGVLWTNAKILDTTRVFLTPDSLFKMFWCDDHRQWEDMPAKDSFYYDAAVNIFHYKYPHNGMGCYDCPGDACVGDTIHNPRFDWHQGEPERIPTPAMKKTWDSIKTKKQPI